MSLIFVKWAANGEIDQRKGHEIEALSSEESNNAPPRFIETSSRIPMEFKPTTNLQSNKNTDETSPSTAKALAITRLPRGVAILGQITFVKNAVVHLTSEELATLDDLTHRAQLNPALTIMLVGSVSEYEIRHSNADLRDLATRRAINVKSYLVQTEYIDPSRIELRIFGQATAQATVLLLVLPSK